MIIKKALVLGLSLSLLLIAIYFVGALSVFAATCDPNSLQTVAYGQTSAAVTNAQACLIEVSYNIPAGATGFYGGQTKTAVINFYASWYGLWDGMSIGPQGITQLKNKVLAQRTPQQPSGPIFNSFTVSPTSTSAGSQVTLSWSVSNVGNCRIKGGSYDSGGTVPNGSATTVVSQTTTFTLTCPDGSSNTRTATVTVAGAPASGPGCEASPIAVGQTDVIKNVGDNYTVNWKSNSLATSCTLYKGTGVSSNVPCTSSITESQSSAGQYSYRIAGTGRDSSGNTVTVMSPTVTVTFLNDNDETDTGSPVVNVWRAVSEGIILPLNPVINVFEAIVGSPGACTIDANPKILIVPRNTSMLTWSCDRVISGCAISDDNAKTTDIGAVASSDSGVTPSIDKTTKFTLQCPGVENKSITVKFFSPFLKEVIPQ